MVLISASMVIQAARQEAARRILVVEVSISDEETLVAEGFAAGNLQGVEISQVAGLRVFGGV